MKIKIITVGKLKEKCWQLAAADYTKRIGRYTHIESAVVKDSRMDASGQSEKVKQVEAQEIAKKVKSDEWVVATDRGGAQLSSEMLADFLNRKMLESTKKLTFVIGGPLGLSREFIERVDFVLSFSKMTLPHELAKVVLLEQLYRAFSIIKGESYHK